MVFVYVAKGAPLLPACFFPFYFLHMYEYVRGIWLGDRRDVRLVSYQRDLGVGMFPGGEVDMLFVGHSIKAECCLCTLFFISFIESYDYCFKVQHLACSLR